MKATLPVLLLFMAQSVPVWAVLGESESSISLDQQFLRGTEHTEARQNYRVHQILSANGVTVKEFVSSAGTVFGIAWQGPQMPNLSQLLGSNMTELQLALQSRTGRHVGGPLIVRTQKLVLVSAGHMRSFHGYAYIPKLMPAQVLPEVLQ